MDAMAALLDGPRARGAFVLQCVLDAPWALRIEDEAPLTVVAVVRGDAVLTPAAGPVRHLGAGDVAVLRGPDPYTVADDAGTQPQVLIAPGQVCMAPDRSGPSDMADLGLRAWGNSGDGETLLVTGTYKERGEVSGRLLAALPPVVVLPAADVGSPLVTLLATESARDAPGQEAVLDRLLDLLLIAVLRAWFARPDAAAPGWYRAHADPVVGHALRLVHDDPARSWTVATLARAVGVSRSEMARRFTRLVGEPPMTYLADWRLALAADLLLEPGATIASVAPRVGYSSAFALSAAFKRVRGVSPQQHRAAVAAA